MLIFKASSARSVYDHLHDIHGSIGDGGVENVDLLELMAQQYGFVQAVQILNEQAGPEEMPLVEPLSDYALMVLEANDVEGDGSSGEEETESIDEGDADGLEAEFNRFKKVKSDKRCCHRKNMP